MTDTEIHVTVPADTVSGEVEVRSVPVGAESNAAFLHAVLGDVSLAQNVQPVFNRYCAAGGCLNGRTLTRPPGAGYPADCASAAADTSHKV